MRYADDIVVGFRHRSDAERCRAELTERFSKFALELHPDKTRLIEFGPFAAENRRRRGQGKPETFDFLGFTHICATKRSDGRCTVLRQTMRKRLQAKLGQVKTELRRRLHDPVPEMGSWLRSVVGGHLRYYGVPMNSRRQRRRWVLRAVSRGRGSGTVAVAWKDVGGQHAGSAMDDLMDAAYDAAEIRAHSESLGHVPIIDVNPRNSAALKRDLQQEAKARRTLGQMYAKGVRYRERSTVERVNGRLKDEFGARQVRVRGHSKVLCHLMFGILALTVDQLLRFVN